MNEIFGVLGLLKQFARLTGSDGFTFLLISVVFLLLETFANEVCLTF